MSGRKRGETRDLRDASRAFSYRYGLISMEDHAALVVMLAIRQSIDEAIRMHSVANDLPDLPTARAPDPTTPKSVPHVDKSPQADVWRHFMNNEFVSLLQAGNFAPALA